ncbi:MAG: VCBS repeat-containing protein [Acidobacteria bacterium]|nr:VCBS repeat-containing protein [Acidobacteriota bacterium]
MHWWRVIVVLAMQSQLAGQAGLQQGQTAFQNRDWAAAERHFLATVRAQPSNAAAHKWLGMTYAVQEKFVLSEEPFRRACGLSPKEPDACYYWGRTLYMISRFEDALQAFQKDVRPFRGKTLLGTALAEDALGRDAAAEKLYLKAIAAGSAQAEADYQKFRRKRTAPGATSPLIRLDPRELPVKVVNGASGEKRLMETMLAGVAVIDFDRDGWPDIYICNGAGAPNALLRNNHDGTFRDVAAAAGVEARGFSMGVASADFDNDGFGDLFVTGLRKNHLFRNRGNGTFEQLPFPQDGKWSVAAA